MRELHGAIAVRVVSSTQDHMRNVNRTTSKTFFIQPNRSDGTFTVIASAAQDISLSSKLIAILRETNSAERRASWRYGKAGGEAIVALSATKLSDPTRAVRSPRPIPGSSAAFWLSHELGGPHASCFSLHKFALHAGTAGAETATASVLVPVVDKIRDGFMDGFAGLYVDSLLARPFVRTGGRAYLLTRTS
ncbi:hypothetical protein EDB92DRAFT_2121149 [Lactarius akahatsu]|uniref:Uncharacterized protein n=1 Tax=Lactarius akahatsu TaxID=416441 RepID=A0AAD4L3W9_9AGAM|nr:hypothetical protein EDB92DRAFT_2121149 [Lactarius akahatsu]